ncbi:unnamed protein product [Lactuca saligna]|uniref:Beta-glucosidase n=1 Tax=Lactuca saligna TaxID=75948 RepID=A0AA36DXF1_LACSI|nr:unnamed protein product [Lactuca saligna]
METTQNIGATFPLFQNLVHSNDFKPDFVWGAATSAYQIEGAASKGGRGESIWDVFCHNNPDAIVNGDNGNNGTNAYFKYKEDVQMMKKMGLNAYRFSISWTRIFPGGKPNNGINKEGIDYYNNLINELILCGITPYVTLFHWDTPETLEEEYMGFLSEKIIYDFTIYAGFCFWEFGDRVKNWITINEPHSYASSGYADGIFPPGRGKDGVGDPGTEPYIVAKNLLLSHASVVNLYRQKFQKKQGGKIGITLNTVFCEPLNPEKQEDKDAALRAIDFMFGWFMEPLFSGKYPDTMIAYVTGGRLPEFTAEEAKSIKGSYDFLGLNYYTSYYATTAKPSQVPSYVTDSNVHQQPEGLDGKPIGPQGGSDWLYSYPLGFYKILQHIKRTYGDPLIFITENGWPDKNSDQIGIGAACVDTQRIDYHNAHLQKLRDAIRDGVRVEGYFVWSLMDNFEWIAGYSIRFGLLYVDYNDGKYTRYPKNSAIWYMNFLKSPEKLGEQKKIPKCVVPNKPIAKTQSTETSKKSSRVVAEVVLIMILSILCIVMFIFDYKMNICCIY